MQDIIAFLVNLIRSIISLCNSNILLQWSLYFFVLFSILFAFKSVFSWGVEHYHETKSSGREPSFRFSNFSQKLLTTGKRSKSK